jgi:hypothetical protein
LSLPWRERFLEHFKAPKLEEGIVILWLINHNLHILFVTKILSTFYTYKLPLFLKWLLLPGGKEFIEMLYIVIIIKIELHICIADYNLQSSFVYSLPPMTLSTAIEKSVSGRNCYKFT